MKRGGLCVWRVVSVCSCISSKRFKYEHVSQTKPQRIEIKRQLPEQIITKLLIPIILLCFGNDESGLSFLLFFSQLLASIVQAVLSSLLQIGQLDLVSFLLDCFGSTRLLDRLTNHLRNGLKQSDTLFNSIHASNSFLSSHLHAWQQ